MNDLPLALEALRRSVARIPGASVAWTAADGEQAVTRCRADRPDLVLMDLIMPVMDGVEATRRIMKECPCPILVVTATVTGNAARVFEALGAGALDAIDTPNLTSEAGFDALCRRIGHIERLTREERGTARLPAAAPAAAPDAGASPVLVGASTGGPQALCALLQAWPKPLPFSAVIVQHLDAVFMAGLAEWLAKETGHRVALSVPGSMPTAGTVWIAGGMDHLEFARNGAFRSRRPDASDLHHPSVDALFESAAAS
ncbi:MAG: chemotaxis protein CheB, partial [Planctomycetota bacterium]